MILCPVTSNRPKVLKKTHFYILHHVSFHIFVTSGDRELKKSGRYIYSSKSYPTVDKPPVKGVWSGSRAVFF